jgi:ligand-binding SRPBCC domain-containing protein
MKLILSSAVRMSPQRVWDGFDRNLFEKLAPPYPRIRLLRFDGSESGDIVEVELNFGFFKQIWQSLITEHGVSEDEIWFVDEGRRLPFFLRHWRHRHRLVRTDSGTRIVDEIEYRTPFYVFDYLMFPLLWTQFFYRKPIYRRVFNNLRQME